jgi:hypothetical protein
MAGLPNTIDGVAIRAVPDQPKNLTISAAVEPFPGITEQQTAIAAPTHRTSRARRGIETKPITNKPARIRVLRGAVTETESETKMVQQRVPWIDHSHRQLSVSIRPDPVCSR